MHFLKIGIYSLILMLLVGSFSGLDAMKRGRAHKRERSASDTSCQQAEAAHVGRRIESGAVMEVDFQNSQLSRNKYAELIVKAMPHGKPATAVSVRKADDVFLVGDHVVKFFCPNDCVEHAKKIDRVYGHRCFGSIVLPKNGRDPSPVSIRYEKMQMRSGGEVVEIMQRAQGKSVGNMCIAFCNNPKASLVDKENLLSAYAATGSLLGHVHTLGMQGDWVHKSPELWRTKHIHGDAHFDNFIFDPSRKSIRMIDCDLDASCDALVKPMIPFEEITYAIEWNLFGIPYLCFKAVSGYSDDAFKVAIQGLQTYLAAYVKEYEKFGVGKEVKQMLVLFLNSLFKSIKNVCQGMTLSDVDAYQDFRSFMRLLGRCHVRTTGFLEDFVQDAEIYSHQAAYGRLTYAYRKLIDVVRDTHIDLQSRFVEPTSLLQRTVSGLYGAFSAAKHWIGHMPMPRM